MPLDRRDFLAAAGASAAMAVLPSVSSAKPVNSDIRVAVVGTRGRGLGHMGWLADNLVAICDVDSSVLTERASQFKQKHGRSLDTYSDYRKLLERDDIDAVSIATPNHTHTLIAIAAIQAGKDVYVEKPVSHNIWEGRQLVAAAQDSKQIVQCGTQSRSYPGLQEAVQWIRGGGLGRIEYVIGTCYKPRHSIGRLSEPLVIPETIDYDLWCGPAEKVDLYRTRLHYDWHWDWNTGNGDMGNQGIHQMDVARWFLGEERLAPRTISIGGRLGYEDAGNTPNTQVVFHDYESAPLIFETRGLPRCKSAQENWNHSMDRFRGAGIGVIVQCENGYLVVPTHGPKSIAFDRAGKVVRRWDSDRKDSHFDNWLRAVEARRPEMLNAPINEGHVSSSLCHTGGVSHQLGEKLPAAAIAEQIAGNELLSVAFDRMAGHLRANGVDIDGRAESLTLGPWLQIDTETEQFVGNAAANELRSRGQQRKPFAVPDLQA